MWYRGVLSRREAREASRVHRIAWQYCGDVAARRTGATGRIAASCWGPARGLVTREQGGQAIPAWVTGRGIFRGTGCGDRMAFRPTAITIASRNWWRTS